MIVTRSKDIAAILAKLAPHRRVALVGCGLCATTCRTGGAAEVEAMAGLLVSHGKEVAWTVVIEGACQKLLAARMVRELPVPDSVLVLACGSGVQTLAGLINVPVYPALDSLFLGSAVRLGRFEKKCSLCGSCTVDAFAGLCPVTLCPKGLLNGPCGGMQDGKCEADREQDCVWYRIYQLKEADGSAHDLEAVAAPRSRRRANGSADGG